MIENETEGLLYRDADEIPELIHKIWDDDAYGMELGAAAMNRAYGTHNAETNIDRLLEIYNEIR